MSDAEQRFARLIYTGNVIVDIAMTVESLPDAGGDALASSSAITAGGGYNVMTAAERDGIPVVFAGQYGTGQFGSIVRSALARSAIEVSQPGLSDVDSGYCVALIDRSTERTFVTFVGAEGQLTRPDLDRVNVTGDDIVYVSGYSLAHPVNALALPGWLESLPEQTRVMIDPSPLIAELDEQLLARVLARTDIFSANAREARHGSGLTDLAACAEWYLQRIRPGGVALVRDGAKGCWLAGAGETALIPPFSVDAIDTNGAGDAHGGVFAAGLARGEAPLQAARRANAAAAIAVTRSGPSTSPHSDEIDALLARLSD